MRVTEDVIKETRAFIEEVSKTKPEPTAKRGTAIADETRPDHFPHRIWAACDFEAATPDYAWFGPAETKNIPEVSRQRDRAGREGEAVRELQPP